jgi:DNA-3-methyladenine glycosylase I
MTTRPKSRIRCSWTNDNPLMLEYHDREWGVPEHDDKKLFEFLILEGAQAGLSWQTVLNKRENYRKALSGFDPAKVARYGSKDVQRLLGNPGIVRNRMKIAAAILNAKKFLEVRDEFGSFDKYIWQFVDGTPIRHGFKSAAEIPATTRESDVISKELRKRGFAFVGSTICYAFMQAVGMANDHLTYCFRYAAIQSKT